MSLPVYLRDRLRVLKNLAQGHTARKGQRLPHLTSELRLLTAQPVVLLSKPDVSLGWGG